MNQNRRKLNQVEQGEQGLDPALIQACLQTEFVGKHFLSLAETSSTQHIAQEQAKQGAPSGTVIVADTQTNGKGRLGRTWQSPAGTGIWMSVLLRPDLPLSKIPQLTLLTAVAMVKGIRQAVQVEPSIKWPNDLLLNDRKLAGILTEVQAEGNRVKHVIIGIGLNVNQEQEDFPEELAAIATSIRRESGKEADRNRLIAAILNEWEALYQLYCTEGFRVIKTLWEMYATSLGQRIVARTTQGTYTGVAQGITDEGVLLLEDEQGNVHKIYSADIET